MNRTSALRYRIFAFCLISLLSLIPAHPSSAQEFSVKALGDYGNVTVMEVAGDYSAHAQDGSVNSAPREVIAREFFKTYKDEYDFLVIFSNFDYPMPDDGHAKAFYLGVKNDTQGLGLDQFDHTSSFGSPSGRLQGTVDMGNITNLATDPLDPKFEESLYVLSHELMHRWGANVKFRNPDGSDSTALLGKDGDHWSFLLDSGGSLLYGNEWLDNGNGTFTSVIPQNQMRFYSPLDLYLMGMIDKTQVPPMLLIENSSIDPSRLPEAGVTITGTAGTVTIDDIIAANGPRYPDASSSRKTFKTALILITAPGTFKGDEVYAIENIRNGWVTRHSVLTDGKSIVQVASTPKEDIPANPGILPPSTTPRTLPPNINDGVTWLMTSQQSDGSWADLVQTTERDTAETTIVLRNFSDAQSNYQAGLSWLGSTFSGNVDYLSRKIEAFAGSGQDETPLVQDLLEMQNLDGGWGSGRIYGSNAADTGLVLKALANAGSGVAGTEQTAVPKAVEFLMAKQKPDGGWTGNGESTIQATANVLSAFNSYRKSYQLDELIAKGLAWLLTKQNPDGGFGNSPSTAYDTALAVLVLRELNASTEVTNRGLEYLLGRQSESGSWNNSAYETALAVNAVYKATVDPDLSIKTEDITIIPDKIRSLPSDIVINANISNLGQTSTQAKVFLYEGSVADQNKIGEQALAFPGQSTTTITFSATARDGSEHRFYLVVDPDNQVKESNELNNTAVKVLYPEATYDFEVLPADVTVTPNSVDQYQNVTITAKITNKGTMNAYNVQVKYFIDLSGEPFEIATKTVNIPANTTTTDETTWRANRAGANLPITVQVDPFDNFTELSETNNKAATTLTVNTVVLTDPNLTVSYQDISITPTPALKRGNVSISAVVKNEGFSTANNIIVNFYRGVPGPNGLLLGTRTIPSLAPNESATVSVDWTDIQESGEKIIYVQVDPDNLVKEIKEDDNEAFVTLQVRSLPDLTISDSSISFTPPAPKTNENVSIGVSVQNKGDQSASNVLVKAFEGNVVIGSQIIPSINGNSVATASFSYDTTGKTGAHQITFTVDPDNIIVEQNESNNAVSKTFGVQDANLWLTEQYISPNGDGVKDSTQFFFRLDMPQSVKIDIANSKGETVGSFSGPEFENTTAGNVTWDGLGDQGMVVDDGQYKIQVKTAGGVVLKEMLVAVDNNNFPLLEALGTGDLVNSDLSCMMSDGHQNAFDSTRMWIPDGSGVMYYKYSQKPKDAGLYVISPDGKTIRKMLSNWLTEDKKIRSIKSFAISSDGQQVAILVSRIMCPYPFYSCPVTRNELWVMDIDGHNLKLLDAIDINWYSNSGSSIGDDGNYFQDKVILKWSPDNKSLAYFVKSWSSSSGIYTQGKDVYTINVHTGVKTKIHSKSVQYASGPQYYIKPDYEWTADGNSIILLNTWGYTEYKGYSTYYYSDWSELWKISKDGSSKSMLTSGLQNYSIYRYWYQEYLYGCSNEGNYIPADPFNKYARWIRNSDLLLYTKRNCQKNVLSYFNVDTNTITEIGATTKGFAISGDKKKIAYPEETNKQLIIYDVDADTKKTISYGSDYTLLTSYSYYYDDGKWGNKIEFSPADSATLAFIRYKSVNSTTKYEFVIVDTETLQMHAIDATGNIDGISWTPGGKYLLVSTNQYSNPYPAALYLIDVSSGEKQFFSYGRLIQDHGNAVEEIPIEKLFYNPTYDNYFLFSAYVTSDGSSGCVPKSSKNTYSLWSTSSNANLNAILTPLRGRSQVLLNGTASDLNFEGYKIEYSAINDPAQWQPIVPFSDTPVVNDTFTTWIPPAEGTFYVKLTVWDKAGNVAETIKRISWGRLSAITGIYKDHEIFSPNGDGVKDTVNIHYTVTDPSHLEFTIVDIEDNPVSTFQKDYTESGEDFITWDGQDESGNVVPDGKYKIKVSGFEFFVEVDNTPPDANVALNPIMTHMVQEGSRSVVDYYYVDMTGLAYDQNLKSWVVEAGEGDNPQEWNQVTRGDGVLAKKDQNNNIITPAEGTTISTYRNDAIASLAGNKYRITAEDSAGNKTTMTSDFLEQKVVLYNWDGAIVSNSLNPEQAKPGLHQLGALETIALPLTQISVQYVRNGQWFDTSPVTDPSTGLINLLWDNSSLDQNQVYMVRLKTVDMLGQVQYSNSLTAGAAFKLVNGCGSVYADVYLPENLKSLKLQIRSGSDPRYPEWTDYRSYDSAMGDSIPSGTFSVTPDTQPGVKYDIQMIGTSANGYTYKDTLYDYPPLCPVKIELEVSAKEKDCGLISNEAELSAALKFTDLSSNTVLQSLAYYIQKPEGRQLLKSIDLTNSGVAGAVINTADLAEGSYSVEAVLEYKNNGIRDVTSASGILVVDRDLPTAQISYPGNSLMSCPVKAVDSKGDWVNLPVEGLIVDDTQIKRYELYYAAGENGTVWQPAMTRTNGQSVQITGKTAVKGQIGNWDITKLTGTSFSLKLKAVDSAGNVSCYTNSFSVDKMVEISSVAAEQYLFSPNGDGLFDDVKVNYQVDENVGLDVKVFKLLQTASGYQLDSVLVRTISAGLRHLGGAGSSTWDGKADSGAIVPDDKYGIAVTAVDSCQNTSSKWAVVEVNNTSPATVISYPQPGDPLASIVEVRGTADAAQFQKYTLEAGQGDNPTSWQPVSFGTTPVKDGILGTWNIFGLTGKWTLRLSTSDNVGNKNSAQVTLDLTPSGNLIKSISSTVKLISPNNDGKYDASAITYEMIDTCNVKLEISDAAGNVKRSYTMGSQSPGMYSQIWDGKDDAGAIAPDGVYKIRLTANLVADQAITQSEAITVTVDTTPPTIDIRQPVDSGSISGDLTVNGTIGDSNLQEYSITCNGTDGTVLLDQGNQSRSNYTFGIINGLPEGSYSVTAKAKDSGENFTEKNLTFTVDRTAPAVMLATPKEGEFYGADKNIINITGSIVENNLETYIVRYGSGDNPTLWTTLSSGSTLPAGQQLFEWAVGGSAGIPDGTYTLSLYAKDKAGLTDEARTKVTIDNTAPQASISTPQPESYVTSVIDIKGTAYDLNLDKYTLELSEGDCQTAFKWAPLKSSATSVNNSVLSSWEAMPPDGRYCLKLTAVDKAGNTGESKINVKVDTHPPAAPVLSAVVENKSSVRLNWTANTEPDFAGYNVYRNSQKINVPLLTDTSYLDQNLIEGVYTYTVKAVDIAGGESTLSTVVKIAIDLTGPDAKIQSPQSGTRVSGIVNIQGTAYSSGDFKQYRIYTGQGANPASWNLIRTSPAPILSGSLAQWNTYGVGEGQTYSLKIEAEDLVGNVNTHQVKITIDNVSPGTPVLVSATATGSDVSLAWNANTESDLAGYLLYRNDQIVNASSGVIGDLKSYLLSGATYLDKSVPDGTLTYYLVAVDQAGNISGQSNSITLIIDTHAPSATIAEPFDKLKFEDKIKVLSEPADLDIASIQFQYKKASDTVWKDLGSPLTASPYITYLDPSALGLIYADYHLRAKATDKSGKTDSSPAYIMVTYTDLTAPATPADFRAVVNGKNVTLTWSANTETDIYGYNIYRLSGSWKKQNYSIITSPTYQVGNLSDGSYYYRITAVDKTGNESSPTNQATAKVYAPVITQPAPVTTENTVQIAGSKASQNSTVEVFVATATGSELRGSTISDGSGNFAVVVALTIGQNKATAQVTDALGNVSRLSNEVLIIHDEAPTQPSGLIASVQEYDVNLTWNANAESDLVGYYLYRNENKLNGSSAVTTGTVAASSSKWGSSYAPINAFDGNASTYWQHPSRYGGFVPEWLEISLPTTELINRVEIDWRSSYYAARDFELQLWTGSAWVTYASITGNNKQNTSIDLIPSRGGQKVRIYMTRAYYSEVAISEVRIFKDDVIRQTAFEDLNVSDGKYGYTVTTVDYYGIESPASESVTVVVGDVVPPNIPQGLSAVSSGPDIILSWSPNQDQVTGYNVYEMTDQGWSKINSSLDQITTYTDATLKNGTYTYRITTVDAAGNESQPSAEASATVFVALPEAPLNLGVSTVSEGKALTISWQPTSRTVAGYSVYRGLTAGGPYTKINASLITGNAYVDAGLENGAKYYYVATSTDLLGNESVYSNEALGVPSDTSPPSKPVILLPVKAGSSTTTYSVKTDISGLAEIGSMVELFQNGASAGAVSTAGKKDVIQNTAIGWVYDPAVSPDGKTLAYRYSNALRLLDIGSGQATVAVSQGFKPVWSGDGSKIAYYDSSGYSRLGLYDVSNGTTAPLTNDVNVYESNPTLSSDGSKIAFLSNKGGSSNVWLKDVVADSVTQITNGISVSNPKLSPDGLRIAYFGYSNTSSSWSVYIYDLSGGTATAVDSYPNTSYLDWSADGKKLAFVSSRAGNNEIFIYDTTSANLFQVTSSTDYESDPHWSPDGNNITYIKAGNSLWIAPYPSGQGRQVKTGYFNYLAWLSSGEITYINGDRLYFIYPEVGYFEFENTPLNPGENRFYVAATDASGNTSEPSDPITVIYDTSKTPDLTAAADEVYLYPPLPIGGEQMAVNIAVWNKGQMAATDVDVDVYMWNANGEMELLASERIPSIAAESAELVSAVWDSRGKIGENRLVVVIDPEDTIAEVDESNNMAIKDFIVTAQEGVALTTTLDKSQYNSEQNVDINITAWNNGVRNDVILEARILDENGYPNAVFDPESMMLAYGTKQTHDIIWNTGSTYAGEYRVHAILKDASGIVAEDTVPFTIVPDMIVDSTIVTDKAGYGPREHVNMKFTIANNGSNYIIPVLEAKLQIVNAAGTTVFTQTKELTDLLPGASVSQGSSWNTGLSLPGDYTAVLELLRDGQTVATKSAPFTVNAIMIITGSVSAAQPSVPLGAPVRTTYTVTNSGNVDALGLALNIIITDPETGGQMAEHVVQAVDVLQNQTNSGEAVFSTQGFGMKNYKIILRYSDSESTRNLAEASFTMKDVMPPVITVLSPQAGATYNSTIQIAASVPDDASGVDKVEYRIDDGTWRLLPAADLSSGRYATTWEPAIADNGHHTISFRATDKAGNTSAELPVSFEIQMDSVPPVTTIAIGEPKFEANGRFFVGTGTAFSLTATDNFSGVAKTEYQVDDDLWTAYTSTFTLVTYGSGTHTIQYRSTDNAENRETANQITVILDKESPETVISASDPLTDGIVNTVSPSTFFTLTSEDALSGVRSVAYRIDTGAWQEYTGSFSLAGISAGQHTIGFKATDNVLNEEAEKTITVRLIVIDVSKKIASDPVVLIAAWPHDREDHDCEEKAHNGKEKAHDCEDHCKEKPADRKEKNNKGLHEKDREDDGKRSHGVLDKLSGILSTAGITHHIPGDEDDFVSSFRSGHYNTYILLDREEGHLEDLEEEIREAVNYGSGVISIKTRPDEDPGLHDLFGVSFKGRTTHKNPMVSLLDSPISNEGTLETAGKALVTEVTATTARTFAVMTDWHKIHPAIVSNQYGRGRAILYVFDLLSAPDRAVAAALLINSINLVHPAEQPAYALASVPVRIKLDNSLEPLDVRLREYLPDAATADTIIPDQPVIDGTITWDTSLGAGETSLFGYHLNLPDLDGVYRARTEIRYANSGDYRLYGVYDLHLDIQDSAADLLRTTIGRLEALGAALPACPAHEDDDEDDRDDHEHGDEDKHDGHERGGRHEEATCNEQQLIQAVRELSRIDTLASNRHAAEKNIERILNAIEKVGKLKVDTTGIRLDLDELLRIWEKKWSLMETEDNKRGRIQRPPHADDCNIMQGS